MLQQERRTIAFERAGAALSAAGEGALRAAVTPYLDAQGDGTRIAVLFGDALAVALGYSPCGIPDRGGLRLAAFEAPHEPDSIALLQG
ncbi:MAG: hypothetical protein FJ037_01650 [Chloroflexi bacterium]|nr:hypothetical protein [Chloroflexota bacterium]